MHHAAYPTIWTSPGDPALKAGYRKRPSRAKSANQAVSLSLFDVIAESTYRSHSLSNGSNTKHTPQSASIEPLLDQWQYSLLSDAYQGSGRA